MIFVHDLEENSERVLIGCTRAARDVIKKLLERQGLRIIVRILWTKDKAKATLLKNSDDQVSPYNIPP